jgi:hypothetical protein
MKGGNIINSLNRQREQLQGAYGDVCDKTYFPMTSFHVLSLSISLPMYFYSVAQGDGVYEHNR